MGQCSRPGCSLAGAVWDREDEPTCLDHTSRDEHRQHAIDCYAKVWPGRGVEPAELGFEGQVAPGFVDDPEEPFRCARDGGPLPGGDLRPSEVKNIDAMLKAGMKPRDIAEAVNTTERAVKRIGAGKSWAKITGRYRK